MSNREMGGDGGYHHEKLGHKRFSCASQFPIPNTAGTSPGLACNNADTRYSQPNQVCCTPDFSYLLVTSTSFSSSSLVALCLVHNSTIIAQHSVRSSLAISPCHDHELTLSTVYSEYSIHRVQHPPGMVCLPFILMIVSQPLNVASASGVPPNLINHH